MFWKPVSVKIDIKLSVTDSSGQSLKVSSAFYVQQSNLYILFIPRVAMAGINCINYHAYNCIGLFVMAELIEACKRGCLLRLCKLYLTMTPGERREGPTMTLFPSPVRLH